MMKVVAMAGLLAGLCGAAHSTCYTVIGARNNVVYSGVRTPVDLSHAIGDTVPEKFGSGAMMISSDAGVACLEKPAMLQVAAPLAAADQPRPKKLSRAEQRKADELLTKELLALKPEDSATGDGTQDATGETTQATGESTQVTAGTQVVLRRPEAAKAPQQP